MIDEAFSKELQRVALMTADTIRMIEEVAFGHRKRLLAEGMDEHVVDHLTANLIATLSAKYVTPNN